ncbi:hypothetical protein [Nonomuraea sp. NPDC049400]|uniref:hypothetical protein n=1 Tax=Nonomuraea sp. NPDC049400 TaxID=3364352 RepID=UPI0037A60083
MTVTTQEGEQQITVPERLHCEVEWIPRSLLEPGVQGWVRFQRTDSVLAELRGNAEPDGGG